MTNDTANLVKNDLPEDIYNKYKSSSLLSVDCEMMGLNPHRDRLCLVQLCNKDKVICLVQIDKGISEAPKLKEILEDTNIKKLFHFGRTDMSFLYHHLGIEVNNVFCTRSASKLIRTYTDKHGLKDLVQIFIGKKIDKQQQSTDWGAEELTKDQMKYAANDVIYLIPIYEKLVEILKRENRLELAEEANKALSTIGKLDLLGYEDFFAH